MADARAEDVPRWRLRVEAASGFGGARDAGRTLAVFPSTVGLAVRARGPLSITLSATGLIADDFYVACGVGRRPNALTTAAGLRLDFGNRRSASWLVPFVEARAGFGGQSGGRETANGCAAAAIFPTGGARAGVDVWLGRAAVTLALGYDYLPTVAPLAITLGLALAR